MQPFWTAFTSEVASRFPLPTKTGYQEGTLGSAKSWFRASQWTGTQRETTGDFLHAVIDNTVQENDILPMATPSVPKKPKNSAKEPKPSVGSTRKIRIYPTAKQNQVLNQWYDGARWTYNQCVDAIETKKVKCNKKELRAYCSNGNSPKVMANPWVLKTPQAIRDAALCDVVKAYKTAFARQTHFKMRFRLKKAVSQSIVIPSRDWKDTTKMFLASAFKKRGAETALNSSELIPPIIGYDCRLQRTRLGHYYFCLLLPIDIHQTLSIPDHTALPRILSIDPGVRTFLTGYDPLKGCYMEWGKGDMKRIERLGTHLDDLISRGVKDPSARRRYKMRKAQMRMRLKIRNLVDEFHKKLTKWLVDNFDMVLLPEFNTSEMVNKNTRKISRPSVRAMMTWSHYRFKQRLLMKAKSRGNTCLVVIVDEHHTTMTCGECGSLHREIGANKIFQCPMCQTTIPRDWNAARNIFLRYITTSTWGQSLPGLSLGSMGH